MHDASAGQNNFGFNTSNNIYFGKGLTGGGLGNGGVLLWNNTQVRYYTLPDTDGTLALVGGSGVGTVTSVAALTLGTTGTDLSSTVANSTTTPVITLNVPTASATNRGALSSADWTTFNNKQAALTNPVTGTGTTNTHAKFTSTSVIGNSMVSDDGTTLTSLGATRSNLYIKAVNNTYYSQLAFTNGTNASTGGISYNNASQYMQFETSTSEWMRLMSDGKLGIGTTSPAYTLDVSGTGRFTGNVTIGSTSTSIGGLLVIGGSSIGTANANNGQIYLGATSAYRGVISYDEGPGYLYIDNTYNNASSNIYFRTKTSGTAITAMTILGSGNVGIGTGSPATKLHVSTSSGGVQVRATSDTDVSFSATATAADSTAFMTIINDARQWTMRVNGAESDQFQVRDSTAGATRMVITSGGDVAIGDSSASGYKFKVNSGSSNPYGVAINYSAVTPNVTGDNQFLICTDTTNTKFAIWSSGTAQNRTGTYGTLSSDLRLKENVIESTSKLNDLLSLRVVNFNFKDDADKKKNIGFIAQEFKEVFPSLVYQRDTREYDKDGNIISGYEDSLSLAVGMEFAILVKAIQEMNTKLDSQNQTIQNLQEQINILAK